MLDRVLQALTDAVLAGAAAVLRARQDGDVGAHYKDATELVTEADRRSDAAMLAVLERTFPAIDPTITFHLEESRDDGAPGAKWVGADPLDGTTHFATGGTLYGIQAHYIEHGVPVAAAICQPEVYLPLSESARCLGRIATAMRGGGAFVQRTELIDGTLHLTPPRRIVKRPVEPRKSYVACVPFTAKMTAEERQWAMNVHESGVVGQSTGVGSGGGNVLMVIFGGQDVYANLGAGVDLDLAPPQVVAVEAGFTVWGRDRKPPVWTTRKQPFIVAPNDEVAEKFLVAAGL